MDYKYGLGKDRRELGWSSTPDFMRYVVVPAQKLRHGEKNGNCKLRTDQVEAIRKNKSHTGPWLAKFYGVTKATIYRIQKKKSRAMG